MGTPKMVSVRELQEQMVFASHLHIQKMMSHLQIRLHKFLTPHLHLRLLLITQVIYQVKGLFSDDLHIDLYF